MSKKKGKKKMDNITEEIIPEIEEEILTSPESIPAIDVEQEIEIIAEKPVIKEKLKIINKPVMPPTHEIFIIKDQGNSKLVIKKDGTKISIPK